MLKEKKIKRDKAKECMKETNKYTNKHLSVGQVETLMEWAALINERDDDDINKMNLGADAIQRSEREKELAKKDQIIEELEEKIIQQNKDTEMEKIKYQET